MYRLVEPKLADSAFEGRVRMTAKTVIERRRERFEPGSVWIPTDQPLAELIVLLLEPASADSFLQWGYFAEILQPTEYFEVYAMAPLAEQMLAEDAELAAAYQEKLEDDPAFTPETRLQWFYQHSPYADERWLLYPVARDPQPAP